MGLAAESMADKQAREKEEEGQGACGRCGATISHSSCSSERWVAYGRMMLYLDSEKQHKEASVRGYINWETGAMACVWQLCDCSCLAYAYPCAIPCRDTSMEGEQWGLRRPPAPGGSTLSYARTHGITDASET